METNDNYRSQLLNTRDYSSKKFDAQIIYLAGGGLVFTVGFVSKIVDLETSKYVIFLILSWSMFTLTLLINLISHSVSIKTIDFELKDQFNKSDYYDSIVKVLNIVSMITLILAIILFLIFISINIWKT